MFFKLFAFLVVLSQVAVCLTLFLADDKKSYYRSLPRIDYSLAEANKDDVIYTLYTNSSPSIGNIITEETSDVLIKDKDIPTVLIIHGWTTDDNSPWFRPLRDEYFKHGLHNIIFVNWHQAGSKRYEVSSANIKPVGKYIAQFLVDSKVNLEKVHLVGHSLGSQLTSFIGRSIKERTGRKIGRITGLDPAGPMFDNSSMAETERLSWRDADFVDVIHTDIQLFGFTKPVGHVDFYPNKGKHQPGCPPVEADDNCSHARSTLYFIESVSRKIFANESIFNEDEKFEVTISPKKNGKKVVFGQHVDTEARGVYYFETNAVKPFLLSNKV